MGYYNLPAQKLPESLNDLEKLLRALALDGSIEALDLLETITRNAIQHPTEEKFRRVRVSNEKLKPLFGMSGSREIMVEMGWQPEGDEFMVLPKSVKLDFPTHVVKILEAKSHYQKQKENAKKTAKLNADPSKAASLQQLEIDRRERAAAAAAAAGGVAPKPPAAAAAPAAPAAPAKPAASNGYPAAAAAPAAVPPNRAAAAAEARAKTATSPASATSPSGDEATNGKPVKTAFDFEKRVDIVEQQKEKELSLQELRALQKAKYNEFKDDPNAKKGEAYQRPPAVAPGGQEQGWYEWFFGSSSSSGGGGGGGGGGSDDRRPPGPRMKTIRDLPQPVRRGG